ncbi:MAG: low temperature requirement protein A [Geodermatophilaceae bacterium]|nr:low temperature requirement protein A [Geodermatophilaceae bacterium]
MHAVTERATVTPLELFFDLVFVFALTQVTALMAAQPSAVGVLRGMLILSVLWWCWVGYAWLGNVVRADEGVIRLAMFGAMAAMFVLALTIPESFDDLPGGLPGPVVFAAGYFVVRVAHLLLFLAISRNDPALRRQVLRFAPSVILGTSFLLIASQLDGPAQTAMWATALVADYLGTMLAGASGWRVNSAGHFAERHGLIIIVALGESIVSIGIGVTELPISWPIVFASALGLALSAGLWWAYFDVAALDSEHALAAAEGERRARLARDGYSYLHLPMIAGIILLSLGLKKVLGYVGGDDGHSWVDPLYGVPLIALYGGVALFLLAHTGFRLRTTGVVEWPRLVAVLVLLAAMPAVASLPSLVTLAVLTALVAALVGFESLRYPEQRNRVRGHEETPTAE